MQDNRQTTPYDIIIAGGGLAGNTQALALSQLRSPTGAPLNIAVIDAGAVQADGGSASYDDRVLALSHGSMCFFQELGLWPALQPAATAIKTIHVSDLGHYGKARLYADDYQVSALGYVIALRALGQQVNLALQAASNVTRLSECRINALTIAPAEVNVTLDNGQQLHAPLLLGCDGGQSSVRRFCQISCSEKDYQQVAVIANVTFSKWHAHQAYERFTDEGPLAILPLDDNRCSLVWTVSPAYANTIMTWDEQEFCQQLNQRFGYWLGKVSHSGKRDAYPLSLVLANEQSRHRVALVGNAGHTLHPIAGQGFNLGVRDIATLTQLVARQWQQQQDIGAFNLTQQYQQQRQSDQKNVAMLTDSLVHIFSNAFLPTVVGRNIGLKVLNYCSALKRQLAQQTMGKVFTSTKETR